MQSCLALEELAGIEDKQEFEVAKGEKCFEMRWSVLVFDTWEEEEVVLSKSIELNFLSFPICQDSEGKA